MNSKEFLICVDSDGCVMDGMTIKHIKCFYPCIAEVWNLPEKSDIYLNKWSKNNLFSQNRGINKFKGLDMFLKEIKSENIIDDDLRIFSDWCKKTKELSNSNLEAEIDLTKDPLLKKVLHWSKRVNQEIEKMPEGSVVPFDWSKAALIEASNLADLAIVSSANKEDVYSEWSKHNLLQNVKHVMTQEDGTKALCINQLVNLGYDKEKTLMIGDAPGDMQSAFKNGVLFYPIIAGKEEKSWEDFLKKIKNSFFECKYKDELMQEYIEKFNENLNG